MPRLFITSGTFYTLPIDFNPANNTVECYGGGANGNSSNQNGGGGGSYASANNLNVAAGTTVNIHIGSAGATDTWFNATSLANAVANGTSISCGAQGANGQTGGQASSSCGTTKFNGGNGGAFVGPGGAGGDGGGGAAGPNGAGGSGGTNTTSGVSGGGGGGANGGANGASGGGSGTAGGAGGNNRFGGGGGAGGPPTGGTGSGGTSGGGGGGGSGNVNGGSGGNGSLDDVYSAGYGPGSGGGGGAKGSSSSGHGGNGSGYGGGGGGGAAGAGSGQNGLIVITYVSVPPAPPIPMLGGAVLSPPVPRISAAEVSIRQPELPVLRMPWWKQPPDLQPQRSIQIIHRALDTRPFPAPNPVPPYKLPWLQTPELLRHPVAGLDFRQQFPGKKPIDLGGVLREDADTASTGVTPVQPYCSINAAMLEYDQVVSVIFPAPTLGGSDDILRRVKHLLPKGWWNFHAPIRDAILGGLADTSAWCYGLYAYAKKQSRVAWATDLWLDIISHDYFGFQLLRRVNEDDNSFRSRIQEELIRERVTRAGMSKALSDLTGQTPYIFEPWNTGDAGAWDVGNFALDIAGGWGDTCLPAQSFVNVIPPGAGIPAAPGWDIAMGWDVAGMWGDMNLISGTVTDQDIYDTINRTRPTGSIVWTQLFPPAGPMPLPIAPSLTPTFAPPVMNQGVVQPGLQRYSVSTSMTVGLL